MKGPIKFKDEQKANPLVKWPELAEEAFSQFSRCSFNEASLSEILRSVGISKGSFYFQFYDKMDLYLCLIEHIGRQKASYLGRQIQALDPEAGFFGKLKAIVTGALDFSRTEPRYNGYWRNFLNENETLKKTVKTAFPEISSDFLGSLVDEAIAAGQLSGRYHRDFIYATISLYFNNMDTFVNAGMTEQEIIARVDEVIAFLKNSLA